MTTLREAAQQALEAIYGAKLCEFNSMSSRSEMIRLMNAAITILEAALAEPVQEPVAWINSQGDLLRHAPESYGREDEKWTSLYTVPPQRKPLTHGEIREMFFAELRALPPYPSAIEELPERFARAIERAHGIGGKHEPA